MSQHDAAGSGPVSEGVSTSGAPGTPGVKYDAGKARVGLMFSDFPRALLKVAEVTTFGAKKYTPSGWVSVPDAEERYDDAKGRHLLLGYIEPADAESQIQHLAHEAWNALACLELFLRSREKPQTLRENPVTPSKDWIENLARGSTERRDRA